jgi:hypothetical protein
VGLCILACRYDWISQQKGFVFPMQHAALQEQQMTLKTPSLQGEWNRITRLHMKGQHEIEQKNMLPFKLIPSMLQ